MVSLLMIPLVIGSCFSLTGRCEFISTVGGEILRGRMVTEKSTHALFGNFAAIEGANVEMRAVINGDNYGITSVSDPEGIRSEMRVELRLEK